jgi:integrase
LHATHALNTRLAYKSAWKAFTAWSAVAAVPSLPATPQTVRNFVTWCLLQGYRLQTVKARTSAIAHYHNQAGQPNPVDRSVRDYIARARRDLKEKPNKKRALTYEMLRRIADRCGENPIGIRNRAMILLCFAAGWRRSEVMGLHTSDVHFVEKGLELWLRSSKIDQTAEGRLVGVEPGEHEATCPVRALRAWLTIRGDWDGPLFLRFDSVFRLTSIGLVPRGDALYTCLKKALGAIGENPRNFGAHSLRAGMITEASKNGASEASIKQRTGHKCSQTLQGYIRPAHIFDFNPLKGVL